jgi:hypothetical protein
MVDKRPKETFAIDCNFQQGDKGKESTRAMKQMGKVGGKKTKEESAVL